MVEYTIDPTKHSRLRTFVAGHGKKTKAPVTLDLSEDVARCLLRKAKQYGFEDGIKLATKKAPEPAKKTA